MISIEVLVTEVSGLGRQDLERWIAYGWVRPDGPPGHYLFHEIDVARVRLIQELHREMQVNEEALPVVLSLLDQVYELRRRMREIGEALDRNASEEVRRSVMRHLTAAWPS
jgi:chaperone modulatory protein CbpM